MRSQCLVFQRHRKSNKLHSQNVRIIIYGFRRIIMWKTPRNDNLHVMFAWSWNADRDEICERRSCSELHHGGITILRLNVEPRTGASAVSRGCQRLRAPRGFRIEAPGAEPSRSARPLIARHHPFRPMPAHSSPAGPWAREVPEPARLPTRRRRGSPRDSIPKLPPLPSAARLDRHQFQCPADDATASADRIPLVRLAVNGLPRPRKGRRGIQ
jgi:hypothetical protein